MEGSVALLMDQKSEQRAHAHTHTRALSRGSEARAPALLETQLTTSAPAPPPEPLVSLGGLAGGSGQAGACTRQLRCSPQPDSPWEGAEGSL